MDCPICLTPAALCTLETCGHAFCSACLRAHVLARAADGALDILCPAAAGGPGSCTAALTHPEMRALLGVSDFDVLDRRALDGAVAADPTLFACSTPDCPFVACWTAADGEPCLCCPLCGKQRCLMCGVEPYHSGSLCGGLVVGMGTPSSGAASPTKAPEDASVALGADAVAAALALAASDVRVCKRCAVPIFKSSGCDKMRCRCGYRFCFRCGSENARCPCTPSYHGFIDNVTGRSDFSNLAAPQSPD